MICKFTCKNTWNDDTAKYSEDKQFRAEKGSEITGVAFQDFLPTANMFLGFIPLEKLKGQTTRLVGSLLALLLIFPTICIKREKSNASNKRSKICYPNTLDKKNSPSRWPIVTSVIWWRSAIRICRRWPTAV